MTASSWATCRSVSGSTSTVCSCAVSPRARSPHGCATTRSFPTPTAARPTARCRCVRSRVDDDHRRLLAALAAASGPRVLLYPRGDLRRTTDRMPSRFLLDTVEALTGTRHYADDLLQARRRLVPPGSVVRRRHRARALSRDRAGAPAARVARPHPPRRGRRHVGAPRRRPRARAWSRLRARACEFGIHPIRRQPRRPPRTEPGRSRRGRVAHSTRAWARSPFDYLMEHILRVEIAELPEEIYELSALDRGSLVHDTLDEFLREVLARPGGAPSPGATWTEADRARLHEIADAQCDRYEAEGLTGRRAFWDRDRRRILADLDRFLAADSELRADYGYTTLATELAFGLPEAEWPAIELPLSDGRRLRFRGAADRVDGTAAGRLLRHRLQDREAVRGRRGGRSHVGRHAAATPRVRARGTERRSGTSTHPVDRGVLVREHARPVPMGGGRTRRSHRSPVRRSAARHRRRYRARGVPVPPRSARFVGTHVALLRRPRRAGNARPLPRLGAQARRARARRIRRARGARRHRRVRSRRARGGRRRSRRSSDDRRPAPVGARWSTKTPNASRDRQRPRRHDVRRGRRGFRARRSRSSIG